MKDSETLLAPHLVLDLMLNAIESLWIAGRLFDPEWILHSI